MFTYKLFLYLFYLQLYNGKIYFKFKNIAWLVFKHKIGCLKRKINYLLTVKICSFWILLY